MMRVMNMAGTGGGAAGLSKYLFNQQSSTARNAVGYYQSGATSPVAWHGKLAAKFGFEEGQQVRQEDLESLLGGTDPSTGEAIPRRSRKGDPRLAVDLSFSAPKSVSILALIGGDQAVIEAHDQAVREALDYLEANYAVARYGKGGSEVERTGKLVAAVARHEDARPVDGVVDPQLHSHALAVNLTEGKDGKLRALRFAFGQDGIKLAGAIYRSALAKRLLEQGYQLREATEGFEIAGISDQQLDAFSRRSKQKEDALRQAGIDPSTATEAQKRLAVETTRQDKIHQDQPSLHAEWKDRARAVGLVLLGIKHQQSSRAIEKHRDRQLADSVEWAKDHLSERETLVRKDALRLHTLMRSMASGADLASADAEIEREIEQGELFHLGEQDVSQRGGGDSSASAEILVTRQVVETETQILAKARAGRDTQRALASQDGAGRVIQHAEEKQGFKFSPDQAVAFKHVLTNRDRVLAVEGSAGVGKTTMMKPLAAHAEKQGYQMIGLTTATAATKPLSEAIKDSRTVAAFLMKDVDPSAPPRLIVLDEAGMVGAQSMRSIMAKLRPQDRLLMVGDSDQLSAVEQGMPFYQAIADGAVRSERNTTVIRQREAPQLLRVVQAYANRDPELAAELAQPFIRDVTVPERGEGESAADFKTRQLEAMVGQAADAYMAHSKPDRAGLLVMAGTRAGVALTNAAIREKLVLAGDLGEQTATLKTLKQADMTSAQKIKATSYSPGQIIRYSERGGKRKPAVPVSVVVVGVDQMTGELRVHREGQDPSKTTLINPAKGGSKWQVYSAPTDTEVRVGDRVMWSASSKARGEANGQRGVVVGIQQDHIQIRDDEGKVRKISMATAHPIDHAYCTTVHKAQGQTVDSAIVVGDSTTKAARAELAYVALSRSKTEDVQVLVADREKYIASIRQWAPRVTGRGAMRTAGKGSVVSEMDKAIRSVRKDQLREQEKALASSAMPDPAQEQAQREHQEQERDLDSGLSI